MFTKTYQAIASGPDVHHDALLSNLAIEAFDNGVDGDGLIADQIFPAVGVSKQSDRYAIIDKGNFLRDYNSIALRAPKTEARRIEFRVSSDTFFADNYALATEIALEDLANADNAFRLRENATKLVVGDLRRAQELRVASLVTSISNIGSGVILTGTGQWNDFVNSDPLADVTTAHAFIQRNTGLVANTGIMDYDTWKIVRRHPDILDMYKYTEGGMANAAQVMAAFDIEKLLIGKGVVERAVEGGTSSMTSIWGRNFVLAHIEAGTSLETRTLGLRLQWTPAGFPTPFAANSAVESGPGKKNIEIIQAEHYQDEKIVAGALGYCIQNTIAS